ncbi:conserved hypothetical protein, partial [Ixodes scapularis]
FNFYKSHNTVKVLHTVAPNGFIVNGSEAYGGRAIDRFITINTGFLDHLEYGDEVLADRGLTISNVLSTAVELALLCFTKGKQSAARDMVVSQKLAKLRIHVERPICRKKCFRMLQHVPSSFLDKRKKNYISDIVITIAGLSDVQPALIK